MTQKEDKLCRAGKLPCPDCGKPMEMYYKPMCFHCKKPEARDVKVYNLVCVLKYLDKKRPGLYDRMWEELRGYGMLQNDAYINMLPINYAEEWEALCAETIQDIKFIYKEYPDAAQALWEVSW